MAQLDQPYAPFGPKERERTQRISEQLTTLVLAIVWADEHLTICENLGRHTDDCFFTIRQYEEYLANIEYVFAYAVYLFVRACTEEVE
jgi:hypothetical protein